jgi:hypothetical protein
VTRDLCKNLVKKADDQTGFLLYILTMAKKSFPLSKTNTYLKNTTKRREGIIRMVISSSAIEGIHGAISEKDFSVKSVTTPCRKLSRSTKSPR